MLQEEGGGRSREGWKGRVLLVEIQCPHSVLKCFISQECWHGGGTDLFQLWNHGQIMHSLSLTLLTLLWSGVNSLQRCWDSMCKVMCKTQIQSDLPLFSGHVATFPWSLSYQLPISEPSRKQQETEQLSHSALRGGQETSLRALEWSKAGFANCSGHSLMGHEILGLQQAF